MVVILFLMIFYLLCDIFTFYYPLLVFISIFSWFCLIRQVMRVSLASEVSILWCNSIVAFPVVIVIIEIIVNARRENALLSFICKSVVVLT